MSAPRTVEQLQLIAEKLSTDMQRVYDELKGIVTSLDTDIKELQREGRNLHKLGIGIGVLGVFLAGVFGVAAVCLERSVEADVSKVEADVSKVTEDVAKVESSVSTRYIGQWPGHFSNVVDLISDSATSHGDDKLLILTDFVANWQYSLPPTRYYDEYYGGIKRALALNPNLHVEILVFDRATTIDRLARQFTIEGFEKDAKSKAYDDYFAFYDGKEGFLAKGHHPSGYVEFLKDILHVQDQFCRLLSNTERIEMRTLANNRSGSDLESYPYFFWMLRNRKMILSFRRYDNDNEGYSFYTSDTAFLKEFAGQFKVRWEASQQPENKGGGHPIKGDYCYSGPDHPLRVFMDGKNVRYE